VSLQVTLGNKNNTLKISLNLLLHTLKLNVCELEKNNQLRKLRN